MADRLAGGARSLWAARILIAGGLLWPCVAMAATVPTIDTEDASLGSAEIGSGRFHPILSVDLRNGDFARGSYDDDAANLRRLPVHLQAGLSYALHDGGDGTADAWLFATSSNGVHSPASYERTSPHAWYESNNLVGLVIQPVDGLRAGLAYAIKTSPNGVSGTSHEASLTAAYEGKHGLGWLHPSLVATVHARGGGGVYTQAGLSPSLALARGDGAAKLSLPLTLGVGWSGFYQAGTGNLVYGSAGLRIAQPVRLGGARATLSAQGLALIRDNRLRQLGDADAEHSTVVPLVQLGLTVAL